MDKLILDALDGDRTAVRALLDQVARGDLDPEVTYWLSEIAARLLEADDEPDARRRPDRIVTALGLGGRVDHRRELRQLANALHGLDGVDLQTIVDHARARGLIGQHLDDIQARKLVGRLIQGSPDVLG